MTTTTRNIIEELKRAATEQGAGEAVRTIAGPTLETWMRALVRSPMKGQPGTIAELLEDAKAIQTMLDRLDAALSAPPDDDPHWEQWTAEALDEMLDDVAHKASSLAQTVLWHHHAANHGIETPENTRRQCLDTLDDLRDLMNRDASRHPLT